VLRENIKCTRLRQFFDYFRAGLKKWIWYEIRVDLAQHQSKPNNKPRRNRFSHTIHSFIDGVNFSVCEYQYSNHKRSAPLNTSTVCSYCSYDQKF
jgi:hypothetical protein